MISEDAFNAWKRDEITQLYFSFLLNSRLEILEAWASGQYTSASGDATLQTNAKYLGKAECLLDMSEVTYDDFNERTKHLQSGS